MISLNRKLLLNTLIKHETLTLTDIGKEQILGFVPEKHHLQLLLDELEQDSYIQKLSGTVLSTYTVSDKGIAEGSRLNQI